MLVTELEREILIQIPSCLLYRFDGIPFFAYI